MTQRTSERRCRIAVLISGSGSNLQSFIDRSRDGRLTADIALVLSNKSSAYGLIRAREAGIPTACVEHQRFHDRESFDRAVASELDAVEPDLVVLAGFMRILSAWFVGRYEGRILNIHPALLPKYPGLDTHARVLASTDDHHGCTVHFVTEELDGGPRILAGRIPLTPGETADALRRRVQATEHEVYPQAAEWWATRRLAFRDGGAWLDGERLDEPVIRDFNSRDLATRSPDPE